MPLHIIPNHTMLTLAIGDFFIPDPVIELPLKFRKLLAPSSPAVPSNPKISQVLCLGNITQSVSTLRFLNDISPTFHIVRGEFDNYNILSQQLAHLGYKSEDPLPFYKVVTADNFRIGITSGYQDVPRHDPLLLLTFAREIDVDILIWGGAHHVEAYTLDGKFFINPGSATGAFSFSWPEIDEKDEEDEEDIEEDGESAMKKAAESHENATTKQSPSSKDSNEKEGSTAKPDSKENEEVEEFIDPPEESSTPSFCLLDTQGLQCTLYIYTQINEEVKVDKVMYLKDV